MVIIPLHIFSDVCKINVLTIITAFPIIRAGCKISVSMINTALPNMSYNLIVLDVILVFA